MAVFVDGCFSHSCPELGRMPKANSGYWEPKLARNVERDRAKDAALEQAAGTVLRFNKHVDSGEAALVADAVVRASWPGDSPMI